MSKSLTPFQYYPSSQLNYMWPFPCLPSIAGEGSGEKAVYSTYIFQKTQLRPEFHSFKEEGCHTASRSGHCAALLQSPGPHPGHQLLLFGGCNSAEPEVAGHWSHGKIKVLSTHISLRVERD